MINIFLYCYIFVFTSNIIFVPTFIASVHPCRHGAAMLNILNALKESGNVPTVDQYLFIFLKFIQSVIPTIEYDYTIDVQAS